MNKKVMISLIGEQPAPNVLPLRYYKPDHVILVYTKRTARLAERIAQVAQREGLTTSPCYTNAYRIDLIQPEIERCINEHGKDVDLIFNLTGGTKTMEFAALEIARGRNAQAFYYQTEDNQRLIHSYFFRESKLTCQDIAPVEQTLTIDEFLTLYIGEYKKGVFQNDFERAVAETLQNNLPSSYELYFNTYLTGIGPNVEVDLILRYQNTFAVGEVKQTAKKTAGIDQLNGVTDQRTLGTYTKKFLLSVNEMHPNDQLLAEAYRIKTVTLLTGNQGSLSEKDKQMLVQAVRETMEGKQ
jgi:hypothetical protein